MLVTRREWFDGKTLHNQWVSFYDRQEDYLNYENNNRPIVNSCYSSIPYSTLVCFDPAGRLFALTTCG